MMDRSRKLSNCGAASRAGRAPFWVAGRAPFLLAGRAPFLLAGRAPFLLAGRAPFLLAAALSLFATRAHAGDVALAEELFREGKAEMLAGDYVHGCPKLSESYRQDAATGTLFALAMCEERSGQLAKAWAHYNAVVGRAELEGRRDREQAARRRAALLEPKLSRLTLEVPLTLATDPDFVLTCDGQVLPSAAFGTAMPLDPGEHVLEARAAGKKPQSYRVVLAADGDQKLVHIRELEPEALAPESVPERAAPHAAATPNPPRLTPHVVVVQPSDARPRALPARSAGHGRTASLLQTTGLVAGSVGLVGLGVGAGFALAAKRFDQRSSDNGHCDASGCDSSGLRLNQRALTAGRTATLFALSGGALVAAGITLFVVGRTKLETRSGALTVSPVVATRGLGLSMVGGF